MGKVMDTRRKSTGYRFGKRHWVAVAVLGALTLGGCSAHQADPPQQALIAQPGRSLGAGDTIGRVVFLRSPRDLLADNAVAEVPTP